jgi:two-component system, NtrC family, response regulator AlgB
MRRLLENARQAAASNATILLIGESGTGKTMLAKRIHRWSLRCSQPFSIINCASLVQQSPEGEDYRRGLDGLWLEAGRGPLRLEGAEGGTLFLAGIDELSPELQPELTRFVQERTLQTAEGEKAIDVRIIAASNRDFAEEVKTHRFREDLFYALNILSLRVPPLRERPGDICPLAVRLLAAAAIRNDRADLHLSAEAAAALTVYGWPGNVRELRNAMEAAAVLCQGEAITLADLPESVSTQARSIVNPTSSAVSLDEIEREHILQVLAESRTLEQAAATLGIDVATLWRKRKRHKLTVTSGWKSKSKPKRSFRS